LIARHFNLNRRTVAEYLIQGPGHNHQQTRIAIRIQRKWSQEHRMTDPKLPRKHYRGLILTVDI
jgi:hypothetical protein